MTPTGNPLSEGERELLRLLRDSAEGGSFAVSCDGAHRAPAQALEAHGYARWHGERWGSSFWSITDEGRAALSPSHRET